MTTTLAPEPTITVVPATDADLLDAAADYIVEHGWCQKMLEDPAGAVCLWGAIIKVTGADVTFAGPTVDRTAVRLLHVLDAAIGESPVWWNDHPWRLDSEVVGLLRRSAESLRTT